LDTLPSLRAVFCAQFSCLKLRLDCANFFTWFSHNRIHDLW